MLLSLLLVFGVLGLPAEPAASATPDVPVIVRDRTWTVRGGPTFAYGRSGDVQVMGDWNGNGIATPGVFRNGRWYLRNQLASGAADLTFTFGRRGDVPIVGDWNGNGRTTVGVVRGTTWQLRNSNSEGAPNVTFTYGRRGDVPVTGDWNGNGRTGIGVVRGNQWLLRNTLSGGSAQVSFAYVRVGDRPVTGDWNGNGRTTPGVVDGRTWYLRDQLSSGSANRTFAFGACGDVALSTSSARTAPGVPVSLRGTEWTRLPTTEKVVALTFDAGANADGLPSILKTLESTGTPATFFLTGKWTDQYPTLARQVAAKYPVANHTATHPDLTLLSDTAVRNEIIGAHQTIRTCTGREPRPWFRFPYGARDSRTIALTNCTNYGSVRWTVDTLGWKGTSGGQSVTTVTNRVLDTLAPGSIVLMHVGSHPTDRSALDADALPRVIKSLTDRGYSFVTLDAYR
jgi:peptidoglycan/xylan/chitin deacetylase (PgdA/CDA1 family)